MEHGISIQGHRSIQLKYEKRGPTKILCQDENKFLNMYYQTNKSSIFKPRNIFIDTDPDTINNIKTSKYSQLFDTEYLISGEGDDCANIYARGHYTVGKELIDTITEAIRKQTEMCDNLDGFICTHSISGGTGSGLATLILERIAIDYMKKSKFSISIMPNPLTSESVVDPYNSGFTINQLIDYTEMTLMLDNMALDEICRNELELQIPTDNDKNKLCTKAISSFTQPLRAETMEGSYDDMREMNTCFCGFPRGHFLMTAMTPIIHKNDTAKYDKYELYNKFAADKMAESVCDFKNWMVKIEHHNLQRCYEPGEEYMGVGQVYRGNFKAKEVNQAIRSVRSYYNRKLSNGWTQRATLDLSNGWIPMGCKVSIDNKAIPVLDDDILMHCDRHVTHIANHTEIGIVFKERILEKFNKMYSQRAFVHWYQWDGMDAGEFSETSENLQGFCSDLWSIIQDHGGYSTDECDDDSD